MLGEYLTHQQCYMMCHLPTEEAVTVSPVRLNHAVLYVSDLERAVAFYQAAFGMEVMAREPRANAALIPFTAFSNTPSRQTERS